MSFYEYKIIRSKRKTISIEIKSDLSVTVRVPMKMKDKDINSFIELKHDLIEKHMQTVKLRISENEAVEPLTEEELRELTERARKTITERVKMYADRIGADFGKISIRHQRTRWGSCSGKGNLSFNCLLMLCPENVLEYVIIHELCHIKHMNHSREFWYEVERYCPDYRSCKNWLRENGNIIIKKARKMK